MNSKSYVSHLRHSPEGLFHQDLEKILDVFNITLARQQAHMEVKTMKTFQSSFYQLVDGNPEDDH